uniref:BRCT domain-containing protein n=1 Tax=Schistocephalus solidus TaxID=70667 RepID=A0A0X3P385_SCHSO
MPEVKPERILSCSTEDKAFPASNLLKVNAFYKWKCEEAGAKQAFVIFKFGQAYQFNRLDIGNEGSAFVEVLVSRSATDDTFEVLLPSSSFMSPMDAKQGKGLNCVRIFGGEELTKSVAAQKWDVVKVVCTQPFSKAIQYGLAFIRFYHLAEEAPAEEKGEKVRGAWFFKGLGERVGEPSTSTAAGDTDVLKPGGLFKMARQSSQEPTTTLAQKLLEEKRTVTPPTSPAAIASAPPPPSSLSRAPTSPSAAKPANPKGSAATSDDAPAAGNSGSSVEPPSTSGSRKPILSGVVVAFSGYQNPFRSELRTLCLRLGAKYCQDWTDQCTHLICAFPNTPKFHLVRGKGIIVSHKWIQACNMAKKKVSWRPYRIGRAPSPVGHVSDDNDESQNDSFSEASMIAEDEVDEWKPGNSDVGEDDESESMDSDASAEAEEDEFEDADDDASGSDTSPARRRKAPASAKAPSKKKRRDAGFPGHIRKWTAKKSSVAGDDDMNGDWKPVRRKKVAGLGSLSPANGAATHTQPKEGDEEEDTDGEIRRRLGGHDSPSPTPLPDLPDFFADKSFFIFSKDMPEKEDSILRRLIIAFAGKIENYMASTVNFVVSRTSWCSDFDDALSASPTVVFVKPDWIYACDKAAKYVPYQRFQIVD